MKNSIIFFVVGAAVGATGAWFYARKKYEAIANEEINSVKEYYKKIQNVTIEYHDEPIENPKATLEVAPRIFDEELTEEEKEYIIEDVSVIEELAELTKKYKEEDIMFDKPYLIEEHEFGDYGYTRGTLEYFPAENILISADDPYDPIEDVNEIVGDILTKIDADFTNEWLYIRNDAKHSDYELFVNGTPFEEREV